MDDVFTSVEGRPKRHQGITGQTIEAQMRGTMCQITEYELDVLREGIARLTALVDARTGECQAKAQIIALLEAERDAIAAAAYEVAAGLPRDPNWVWRFEPRWSARDLSEAIRALTPADAQAALDARINAAREEGRIMGLREAFAMAEDYTPDKHTLGGPAAHVTGKSIQNAILAKIKEADHD